LLTFAAAGLLETNVWWLDYTGGRSGEQVKRRSGEATVDRRFI
jgi:hypothetical protein